jgi:hypothetical protein
MILKKQTIIKRVEKEVWVADDGEIFDSQEECSVYEFSKDCNNAWMVQIVNKQQSCKCRELYPVSSRQKGLELIASFEKNTSPKLLQQLSINVIRMCVDDFTADNPYGHRVNKKRFKYFRNLFKKVFNVAND